MSDITKSSLKYALDHMSYFHPYYNQIMESLINHQAKFDQNLIIPSSIYLSKKLIEEDDLNGVLDISNCSPTFSQEIFENILKIVTFNSILNDCPCLTVETWLENLNQITKICPVPPIVEDITYKFDYFKFMLAYVEISRKIFEKFFERVVLIILKPLSVNCDLFFDFFWITFCCLKKIILKRKNEIKDTAYLLALLYEELMGELLNINQNNYIGDFNAYINEIFDFFKTASLNGMTLTGFQNHVPKINLKEKIRESLDEIFHTNEKEIDSFRFQFISSNFPLNFEKISNRFSQLLIPDEIDDMKVFYAYFASKKNKKNPKQVLQSPSMISKMYPNSNSTSRSTQNSAMKNFSECSPLRYQNMKQALDIFLEELTEYSYFDISYLFQHFAKFDLENHANSYKFYYEYFFKHFISVNLFKGEEEKLENYNLNYYTHKNLFLKLIEEVLNYNKSKHSLENLNEILNDDSFYENFLIVSFFVHLNFDHAGDDTLLEKLIFDYMTNLNSYEKFDFPHAYRIISHLLRIELPFHVKNLVKHFLNYLISYVLWSRDSFFVKKFLEKGSPEENLLMQNEAMKVNVSQIVKTVYQYSCLMIYSLGKAFEIDKRMKEKIWFTLKYFLSFDFVVMVDNFLDNFIIEIFAQYFTEFNSKGDIESSKNLIIRKYSEIKKKSAATEIFEKLLKLEVDTSRLKKGFEIIRKMLSQGSSAKDNNNNLNQSQSPIISDFVPKANFLYNNFDYQSFYLTMTVDYSTIYSYSPIQCITGSNSKSNSNEGSSSTFTRNKRIRQLTPTLEEKILIASPNRTGGTTFKTSSTNSAFKNLNSQFESCKSEKN